MTPSGLEANFQKNLTRVLEAVASSEDMMSEMEAFEDLTINITRRACETSTRTARRATEFVFDDENLESEESQRVVYRMEIPCGEDEPSDAEDRCDPTEMRMAFTSVRDGDLDVDVLMTTNQRKMATIRLYATSAAIELSVSDVKPLLEDLVGTSTNGPSLPSTMQGAIEAKLEFSPAVKYVGSFSVTEDIQIQSDATDEGYDIRLATAMPAAQIEIDVGQQRIDGALEMNSIYAELTTEISGSEQLRQGRLVVNLGGFGTAMTLAEQGDNDTFRLRDINIGSESTFVEFNGARLVTIDLNKADGRKLTLTAAVRSEASSWSSVRSSTWRLRFRWPRSSIPTPRRNRRNGSSTSASG